jgi:hypothetical protein
LRRAALCYFHLTWNGRLKSTIPKQMSSLAEAPELVGFFSYSRKDDELSQGSLSQLRARIHNELRMQLGREVRLWQDTAAIPHGALWEDEIRRAIAESTFFIPIVTPNAVASSHCKFEFESFLKREAELARSDLIFPILYVRVPALEDESQWRDHDLLKIVGARQYFDWQKLRFRVISSPEVSEKVEQFCASIFEALSRKARSPKNRVVAGKAQNARRPGEVADLDEDAGRHPSNVMSRGSKTTSGVEQSPTSDSEIGARTAANTSWFRSISQTRTYKAELGAASVGVALGLLVSVIAISFNVLAGIVLRISILPQGIAQESQGVILLTPVLASLAIAVLLKRYKSPLEMRGVLAYTAFVGIAASIAMWCGVAYGELLMVPRRRQIDNPGFIFGFAVAGLALLTLIFLRLRRIQQQRPPY